MINDRINYASSPEIYWSAINEMELLNKHSVQKYCKHCCTLTNEHKCSVCNGTELQPIIINIQKGMIVNEKY